MEQISASFELISHPDRTLREHLDSCNELSMKLLDMKFVSNNFYLKTELEQFRKLLVYFHDFGKATDFFQSKIIDAVDKEGSDELKEKCKEYIEWFKKTKYQQAKRLLNDNQVLGNHALLGAYLIFSNFENNDKIIEYILLKVIRRHHGYLTNFLEKTSKVPQVYLNKQEIEDLEVQIQFSNFENYLKIIENKGYSITKNNWENIKPQFESIRAIEKVRKEISQKKDSKYFFLQHYLFSLLLSADKGDMMVGKSENKWKIIKENQLFKTDIIDYFKAQTLPKEQKAIDINRESAYQDIIQNLKECSTYNFFSITLPTGMGKTFSAYNAAIFLQNEFTKQTDEKKARIIYCLPFTSIIDQNSSIISQIAEKYKEIDESFSTDLIAKHHYLADYGDKYNETDINPSEAEYLTEGWEQEFIVTTFVQFLESIFTNQNRTLRKFHNMTNAIIVLDEVQNIPPKYYEAIELVFTKMAEYFNTKFLFVTATQPILLSKTDVIELTDPTKTKTRAYFENLERICINQSILKNSDYQPQDLESELVPLFIEDIETNTNKSFLFIFNTIAQSQLVYEKIHKQFGEERNVIYLSGSILSRRRRQIIQLIKRNIKYKKPQIVISTQVVEAGVDIDLDIVYRDLSPLDSINQSAGRCNRNGVNGKGTVKVFNTGKHKYIYDPTLILSTVSLLKRKENIIEEKEIFNLNNEYFQEVYKNKTIQSNSSETLIDAIYKLELETIQKEFKLIDETTYYYNVYIPYNKEAENLWTEYLRICKIEDFFERKQQMKKLKPKLLQYITRFPKNKNYLPNEDKKDRFIIDEPDWKQFYDLKSGYKLNYQEVTHMCL